MRISIKVFEIIAVFGFCLTSLWAQDDWTLGATSSSASSLAACNVGHRSQCSNECHGKFDSEYTDCLGVCLEKICSNDVSNNWNNRGEEADDFFCLETESEACASNCSNLSSSAGARCRRSCLEQHCPDAPRIKVAEEAADPGILRCERCRQKHNKVCVQQCIAGTFIYKQGSGLIGLGCEKACLMTMCAASCGARFPLN